MSAKQIYRKRLNKTLCMRLQMAGRKNAPYFFINVTARHKGLRRDPIERVGEYNPHPQADGSLVYQLKFERIKYWLARGLEVTDGVRKILTMADLLPSLPRGRHANDPLTEEEKMAALVAKEKSRLYYNLPQNIIDSVKESGSIRMSKSSDAESKEESK